MPLSFIRHELCSCNRPSHMAPIRNDKPLLHINHTPAVLAILTICIAQLMLIIPAVQSICIGHTFRICSADTCSPHRQVTLTYMSYEKALKTIPSFSRLKQFHFMTERSSPPTPEQRPFFAKSDFLT